MDFLFITMQGGEAAAAAGAVVESAPVAMTTEQTVMTVGTEQQAAPQKSGGSIQFLGMMVLLFAVMYFFMIRPQQKRQKELSNFRNTLEKGQKIITAGGIYGTIREIKDGYVVVEIDKDTTIRVDKGMVMRDNSDVAAAQQQKAK